MDFEADISLFIKRDSSHILFLLIYLDDKILIWSSSVDNDNVINALFSSLCLEGSRFFVYFPGIEASWSIDALHFSYTTTFMIFWFVPTYRRLKTNAYFNVISHMLKTQERHFQIQLGIEVLLVLFNSHSTCPMQWFSNFCKLHP